MRLFVAADLSDEQRAELRGLVEGARKAAPFEYIRWIPEANWHATLAFIGDRDESTSVEAELDRHLSPLAQLQGVPGRIQAFPYRDSPRLLAFKLIPSETMLSLYWRLSQAFGIKERNFRMHITIARFRDLDEEGVHMLNSSIKDLSASKSEAWQFDNVTLYESVLKQTGAEYKPLKTWPVDEK